MPLSNFGASKHLTDEQRPLFAWGHQPMTSWFDATIDDDTKLPTLTLGGCQFVLVWVLPAFGCSLGSSRDSTEGDEAFDLQLRPRPLQLPVPLITEPAPGLRAADLDRETVQ
jgi:hypothetical protein